MAFFTQQFDSHLFIGETQAGDRGYVSYIIPQKDKITKTSLDLDDALTGKTYDGSFVFSAIAPVITTNEEAEAFAAKIDAQIPGNARALAWLMDSSTPDYTINFLQINQKGSKTATGGDFVLAEGLNIDLKSGADIDLPASSTTLQFSKRSGDVIDFSGPSTPNTQTIFSASLDFSGALRGCIQFPVFFERDSLFQQLQWGFQFLIPYEAEGETKKALSEWLPLASSSPGASDFIGFQASIDPTDVYNDVYAPAEPASFSDAYASRRSFFDFIGKNYDEKTTTLNSYYQTAFGAQFGLLPVTTGNLPARFVISLGETISSLAQDFHFAPEGDFQLTMPTEGTQYLMCGLQGTEFFKVNPGSSNQAQGDKLRFISRKPSYAPKFPFAPASPVAAPESPKAPLLDGQFLTSWLTIVGANGSVPYVSQPKGSALYGEEDMIAAAYPNLFGHTTPAFNFSANDDSSFPMVPYLGLTVGDGTTSFSREESENLESQVISQTRRQYVGEMSEVPQLEDLAAGDQSTITTPSGILADITTGTSGIGWNSFLLGQNTDGADYSFSFEQPKEKLVEAMQTSNLFLVVANNDNLEGDGAVFNNNMSISGWELEANVGVGNRYNDYRNIMIVKGRPGPLYDPDNIDASLVANSNKWSQRNAFASPKTDGVNNDSSQLVILSQWMQSYFEEASRQSDNEYFKKFNEIALSETWTGILVLKMDIKNLPDNLAGIRAGITAEDNFVAHHFAIEISPVKKDKETGNANTDQPSSMFGLIYYVDPDFNDVSPVQSIAPSSAANFDFRVLTLKVLFENTAVKNFESFCQLTMNQQFDTTVTRMGDPENIFKNILLQGSFQLNNGNPVYSMGSTADNSFYLDNNMLNKVEVTNLVMSTRNTDEDGKSESWFALEGFMDFNDLTTTNSNGEAENYDILSFGNVNGSDEARQGLSFSNLGIRMLYETNKPTNKELSFDASEITFDTTKSTPRKNSIFLNLALDVEGLIEGTVENDPNKIGYLTVIPDLRLSSVSGSKWFGIRYRLNMGSPGELAGKVNLNSFLLMSWSAASTGDNYRGNIAISLPGTGGGAKLISLQSVMTLSIGQIRLTYVEDQSSFLLMFTEIALKFLGLLKIPPNGSTLFYLFGNPKAEGKASGLGWYAMYRNVPATSDSVARAQVESSCKEQ